MPKSWIGSRYTGYNCTSSRLRKVASEVTGPGVTTWRLVRIRPRSASTTNPVACAVVFHSVSKARTASTSIETTLLAMRSSVTAQSGLPSTTAGAPAGAPASWPGGAGGGPPGGGCAGGCAGGEVGRVVGGSVGVAVVGAAAGAAVSTGPAAPAAAAAHNRTHVHNRRRHRIRDFFLAPEQHEQPHDAKQYERHEHGGGADVLGESGQGVAFEPDPVNRRFDGAVQQFHDED